MIKVKLKENDEYIVLVADSVDIRGSKYVIRNGTDLVGAFADNCVDYILVDNAPKFDTNYESKKLW